MFLSSDTLTSIIRTGLPILVELIHLVNSVIISLYQTTLLRWLTYSDPRLWLSWSCSFGFISYFWRYFLFYNGFPSIKKFWSCCLISIDFSSNSQQDALFHCIAYDNSHADLDGLQDHLRDVPREDIFKLGTSAAASEFCEWVQVVLDVYISHRKY